MHDIPFSLPQRLRIQTLRRGLGLQVTMMSLALLSIEVRHVVGVGKKHLNPQDCDCFLLPQCILACHDQYHFQENC